MGAFLESTSNETMHAYCGLLAHSWVQYIHLVGAKFKLSSTNTSRKVVVPVWYETLACSMIQGLSTSVWMMLFLLCEFLHTDYCGPKTIWGLSIHHLC